MLGLKIEKFDGGGMHGATTKKRGNVDACTSAVGQKPLKWALISAVPWLAAEMKMAVNNFFFSRQNRAYTRF